METQKKLSLYLIRCIWILYTIIWVPQTRSFIKEPHQWKGILYPDHLSAFELDIEYELILEYEDQENIIIFNGTETPDTFYRYSKTISSSGEEGYVFGKNNALYERIVALFENHQPTVSQGNAW